MDVDRLTQLLTAALTDTLHSEHISDAEFALIKTLEAFVDERLRHDKFDK